MSRIPFNRRVHGFKYSKNGGYSNKRAIKLSTIIIWLIIAIIFVLLIRLDPSADMLITNPKTDNIGSIF